MKASELRKTIEDNEVKEETDIISASNFSDEYYQRSHEAILSSYLDVVGNISKSINDELQDIKEKNNYPQI